MSQFLSNYLRSALLDKLFRGVDPSWPTNVYLALMTTAPTPAGGGAELSYTNYARVEVAVGTDDWDASGVVSDRVQLDSSSIFSWPAPGSDGDAPVVGVAVYDAATDGNLLAYADLAASATIQEDNEVRINAGDLSFYIGEDPA